MPSAGNSADLNRYSYSRNNPVKYVDPSGHCIDGISTLACIAIAGALIGAAIDAGIQIHNNYQANGGDLGQAVLSVNAGEVVGAAAAGAALAFSAAVLAPVAIAAAGDALIATGFATGAGGLTSAGISAYGTSAAVGAAIYGTAEIGVIGRLRGTMGDDDMGHMTAYTKIGYDIQARGVYPQKEYYSADLFNNAVPSTVLNDADMLGQVGMPGVVKASQTVPIKTALRLRASLGVPGPRDYSYSFNPDNFPNTFNCATWACKMVNQELPSSPLPTVANGRIKNIVPALGKLPLPWVVTGNIPE